MYVVQKVKVKIISFQKCLKHVAAVVPFDDSQGFTTLDERKDLPLDFRITSFSWI